MQGTQSALSHSWVMDTGLLLDLTDLIWQAPVYVNVLLQYVMSLGSMLTAFTSCIRKQQSIDPSY